MAPASICESGPRAGYDGYKRKKDSKVHMAEQDQAQGWRARGKRDDISP